MAWGRRHLTVVHGEPVDDIEAELLDELFAAWEEIAEHVEWGRIGGVPDDHITVTLAGPQTEEALALATEVALRLRPHHWVIEDTPIAAWMR